MNIPDFLTRSEDGDIRLTGHRIGLEDVVFYYQQGYSPEMLWETFPTLKLADIHKTLGYYLENCEEVDAYVAKQAAASEQLRATIPPRPSLAELRERLESKRRAEEARNAAGLPSG
jgi:uncharacterized protein (DUF433 family)